MDDILASIRRILNDDETAKPATDPGKESAMDDVLVLDASMMVPVESEPSAEPVVETESPMPAAAPPAAVEHMLIAPAAAAAAASSVSALMRTLATERSTATHRGGPTIEDLVREEVRPLLQDWLNTHLPPLVERLVRAEIERVVGRMAQ